jgi:hypothetical protein
VGATGTQTDRSLKTQQNKVSGMSNDTKEEDEMMERIALEEAKTFLAEARRQAELEDYSMPITPY